MADQTLTVTINGKRWRLKFTRLRGSKHGWCEPPFKSAKQILINSQKRSRQRVYEDIIHEALHAADWDKTEEWVAEVARDIARILARVEHMGLIAKVADDQT